MPIEHSIDASERRVTLRASGDTDIKETLAAIERMLADPAFDAQYSVLFDLRKDEFIPSADDVRLISNALTDARDRLIGPVAVLAAPGLRYGLARMTAILASLEGRVNVQAFDNERHATEWLAGEGI